MRSGLDLYVESHSRQQALPTGSAAYFYCSCNPNVLRRVDQLLGGGLTTGQIAELAGASATGKTQFCLSAAANAALCHHRVVYFDSGNSFSPSRLLSVLSARDKADSSPQVLSRVRYSPVFDVFALCDALRSLEHELASQTVRILSVLAVNHISTVTVILKYDL